MEKCSPSLVIKEMQIQTSVRFYLTPIVSSRMQKITIGGEDVEENELFYTGGNVN